MPGLPPGASSRVTPAVSAINGGRDLARHLDTARNPPMNAAPRAEHCAVASPT
ncbi:MAG: hypothetical protein ABW178_04760 [Pseudoxanthomonas sp.]